MIGRRWAVQLRSAQRYAGRDDRDHISSYVPVLVALLPSGHALADNPPRVGDLRGPDAPTVPRIPGSPARLQRIGGAP